MTDTPNNDGARTVTKTATADGVVNREVDGDEQELLRIPISSTRSDREGDRFNKDALEEMADQIRAENPMVFDNHGLAGSWMDAIPYDSRETIGAQMDAELESAEDGEWDLYALVNPDGTHPEGERMLKQVREEGQPIKFSVGFRVLDSDKITDDADNEIGREFTSADLMETSRVGIPANPDASVTQSMTAKGGASEVPPGVRNHPMFQMMQAMGQGGPERDAAGQAVAKGATDSDVVEDATPVDVDGDAETTEREAAPDGGKEDKPKCDSDADCPDGQVCEDGHCVDAEEASADPDTERAPEDIGPADFAEYVASHYDGVDAADVTDALDEAGGDYVGEVDVPELAAHTADVVDEDTGTVQDQFDEWMGDGGDDTEADSEVPEAVKELREENKQLQEEVSEVRDILEDGRGDPETGDTDMSDPDVAADADPDEEDSDDDRKTAMDIARES